MAPSRLSVTMAMLAAALAIALPLAGCSTAPDETQTTTSGGDGLHSTVPNVKGMAVYDATKAIEGAGYSAALTRVPSKEPSGTVVEQNPVAGTSLAREGVVELRYSEGP